MAHSVRLASIQALRMLSKAVVLHVLFGVSAQMNLRDSLLTEARLRITEWYPNRTLMEPPLVKEGISLSMLKHDLLCDNKAVPVGFAEFEVVGAQPVDVFNTVMNVTAQKEWNPKVNSINQVGAWPDAGIRAWDNVFNLIFDKKIEFLIWQVAEANFTSEEFWMVTSTKENDQLRSLVPVKENWIDSGNCLGAYFIKKSPNGAHVVVTQHVHTPLGFWFPLHQILKLFPVAWQGMVQFIAALTAQAQHQASLGWLPTRIAAPEWTLHLPSQPKAEAAMQTESKAGELSAAVAVTSAAMQTQPPAGETNAAAAVTSEVNARAALAPKLSSQAVATNSQPVTGSVEAIPLGKTVVTFGEQPVTTAAADQTPNRRIYALIAIVVAAVFMCIACGLMCCCCWYSKSTQATRARNFTPASSVVSDLSYQYDSELE